MNLAKVPIRETLPEAERIVVAGSGPGQDAAPHLGRNERIRTDDCSAYTVADKTAEDRQDSLAYPFKHQVRRSLGQGNHKGALGAISCLRHFLCPFRR